MNGSSFGTRLRRGLLAVLFLVVLCPVAFIVGTFAAGALGSRPMAAPIPVPTVRGLAIDPKQLDLGEVWETPEHTAMVRLRNSSAESRTITSFATSCDCLAVSPTSVTVPSGESRELSIQLNLTHRQPHEVGLAKRAILVRINPVFSGDFAVTTGWELKGVARSRVSLEASQVAFGDSCHVGGSPVSRKVRATAHLPLSRLQVEPSFGVAARVEPDGTDRYLIVITPDNSLPIGPFKAQVHVSAVMPDGVSHRCAAIDVSGEMQPSVRVLPRFVLLGERAVGTKAEADVTLRMPAMGWSVERVESDHPDTTVSRVGNDPDGAVRYRVTQQVRAVGDHQTQVRFHVRGGERAETVIVDVRCHGQADKR